MGIEGTIIDIYDDSTGAVGKSLVKEGSMSEIPNISWGDAGRSAKKLFAWESESRFPLDTIADIEQSSLYFSKTAHNIPYLDAVEIDKRIKRAAKFAGLSLQKSASSDLPVEKEWDMRPEDFAISIPEEQVSEGIRNKWPEFLYNGHFCLYPLNSEENIKTANMLFPKGLDGDLKAFRPFIAMEISKRIEGMEEGLQQKVANYLPVEEQVAEDQLTIRAYHAPKQADKFEALRPLIRESRIKFASALEALDIETGMTALYASGKGLVEPLVFLGGVEREKEADADIRIFSDKRDLPFSMFEKNANEMIDYFPNLANALSSSIELQTKIDGFSPNEKRVLWQVITGQ